MTMAGRQLLLNVLKRRRSTASPSSSFPQLPPKSYPYTVTLGGTSQTIVHPPKCPHLVPRFPSPHTRFITSNEVRYLEWMLRKEKLGQDMFLIGPPGAYKRRLVNLYAYVMQREVEVLQISRDTTEADIKQTREIRGRGVLFRDQASVRSALEGRILLLDGIEKAERNVLPLLNNLLENREMNLEDGRQLIPHTRYDSLLETHGRDKLSSWKLERVSPEFRVIALGLPVPKFKGNPLDPPLRSRFQAIKVDGLSREDLLGVLLHDDRQGRPLQDAIHRIVDIGFSINLVEETAKLQQQQGGEETLTSVGDKVPWFVVDGLIDAVGLMETLAEEGHDPTALLPSVFRLIYPFRSSQVDSLITHNLGEEHRVPTSGRPLDKSLDPPPLDCQSAVLPMLSALVSMPTSQRAPLLYGPQGSGKSTLARYLGQVLDRPVTTIQVYKDMSVRELLQSRTTDSQGDTIWTLSPLVTAAVEGHVCVLDGLENLHESVYGLLGRLVGHETLVLPDGETLLGGGEGTLNVHPDFRLVGVASSEDLDLSPELTSVFMVFDVVMGRADESSVVGDGDETRRLLAVARELREKGGKANVSLARALSVGQVKRIGERVRRKKQRRATVDLYSEVMNACLGDFLPQFDRGTLRGVLKQHGIVEQPVQQIGSGASVQLGHGTVRIGDVESSVAHETQWAGKVPTGGVFFDIESHVRILESMADDFVHGHHLLLIGNQGVGKNKLVDRLLELIGRGREYVQLHRDTTVSSLTTLQRIEKGVIKTEDSPLVRACRAGLVLVVDEADKAPAHVTACLKALAERGEMTLPDGRTITRHQSISTTTDKCIPLHPDFRMVVLANRPGFPFLGNSFYNVLSHLFSVYSIGNPGLESEVQLLSRYGPSVSEVRQVAQVFSRLRSMSDEGVLSYPYSLREAVHVVRHLEKYPGDLSGAFGNVFDFDKWGDSWARVRTVVEGVFGQGVLDDKVSTNQPMLLKITEGRGGGGSEGGQSGRKQLGDIDPKEGKFDPTGAAHVGGNTWAGGSGGTSTAGLGGVGGPYRLTDGNPVFEISPQLKESVTPEMLERARTLSRQLYAQKLEELRLSTYDASVYSSYLNPILPSIQNLENVLDSLQSQSLERKWVRHQTSGDLDDNKLVEGLIGDKNIYRSRQEQRPEVGDPQQRPKLLRLHVDCSGSMYRFNGYDGRLDRTMSCLLMVMEALKGRDNLIKYEIWGHSGDGCDECFVSVDDALPREPRGRLEVMKRVYLHSQFCSSGDYTLEALQWSLEGMNNVKHQYDQVFLIVLSDANFERYGLRPEEFVAAMEKTPDDSVSPFLLFIGSLGDQADRLTAQLGGNAVSCLDVSKLPSVLEKVFTDKVLR